MLQLAVLKARNVTLASKFVLPIIIAGKVGIKSCRFATECVSFVHVWMQLTNQLQLCLHEQTQN